MKRKSFLKTITGLIAAPAIIKEALKDKDQWKKANPAIIDEMHEHKATKKGKYLFTDDNVLSHSFTAFPFHDGYNEYGMAFGLEYKQLKLDYLGTFKDIEDTFKSGSVAKFLLGNKEGEGYITMIEQKGYETKGDYDIFIKITELHLVHGYSPQSNSFIN